MNPFFLGDFGLCSVGEATYRLIRSYDRSWQATNGCSLLLGTTFGIEGSITNIVTTLRSVAPKNNILGWFESLQEGVPTLLGIPKDKKEEKEYEKGRKGWETWKNAHEMKETRNYISPDELTRFSQRGQGPGMTFISNLVQVSNELTKISASYFLNIDVRTSEFAFVVSFSTKSKTFNCFC